MIYPENSLILAPLSGYTDLAYRRAARKCGCKYAFTEMIDAAAICYAAKRTIPMLKRGDDETFLGVQLVGAIPDQLKQATIFLQDYNFDVLDFNLGCPVPKVVKKNAGAALGQNIPLALECFEVIAKNSKIPVTAKLRILSDSDPIPTLTLVQGLIDRGAQAITIHGRTRKNFYTGDVAFDIIKFIRENTPKNINIVANGGVTNFEKIAEMREKSSCSQVMLAQGAMGNPWLFSDNFPTLEEWKEVTAFHVQEMVDLYGEEMAMRLARKIVHDYLRGRGFPGEFRLAASQLTYYKDLEILLSKVYCAVNVCESTGRKIRVF
jgi:nifR3 family TIM-barrel protein